MAQIVKLRRSSVSGQKPTNTNLQLGELALNTTDGKVFMAKSGSLGPTVEELISTNTVNTGSIYLIGDVTASNFTGSFKGDGTNLYNIPASGVTGLNLTRIADGNATASISNTQGLRINTNTEITGSLIVSSGSAVFDAALQLTENSSLILNSGSNLYVYDGGIISGTFKGNGALLTDLPYATTASNQFFGNQTITGSVFITENLTVLGSSSIVYVTSSQLDIATNIIKVNASNPSVRFGGLGVIDSGSSPQVSGSLLFDSVKDEFLFVHQNQGIITSSVLLMGPETFNNVGNEAYITQNRLTKGSGVEHLNDSNITDNGTKVSINSNTEITGSLITTGTIVSETTPLVSGSSQIQITGTTGYSTFSGSISSSIGALSSSIATIDNNQELRLNSIESSTSSLNSFTSSYSTGSFTGSFIGNGSGLYNIPASGVTGLQLDKIVSGNASASIDNNGLYVNRNVYIDGTITANELYIDYVTSSVLYQSGSTKFGNTTDDNHNFTGSVYIDGSLNADSITGSIDFNNLTNVPTLVSGSSQISYTGITDVPNGIVSGSQQVINLGFTTTSSFESFTSSYTTHSSSFDTRINTITGSINELNTFTSSVVLTSQTSSMSVLTSSYALTASFALNAVGGGGGGGIGTYQTLTQTVAATTWSFSHNVGQRYPIFQVFDDNGNVIIPTQIKTIDENNAQIIFGSAQTGRVIASLGGGNGTTQEFTSSSLWVVDHDLGTDYPDVTIWDSNRNIIFPNRIESVNTNQIKVYFSVPVSGHVSVSRGGHLISGSVDLEWNDILNKPNGIVSGSEQLTGSYDTRYVLSGSITQTTWDNIGNKPNGIVSSSVQVDITGTTGYPTFSGSISSSIGQLSSSIATTDLNQNNRLGSLETESGSIRSIFNSFTSSYTTGAFTGSFIGDGIGLYNIPASGVTGLNLNKLISGSVSASISPDRGFEINTDVYIDGSLTAKELFINYVTSSVLYESGSTKFGDTSDDTHQFTGSVNITGSISLNGNPIGTGKLDETTFQSYTSSNDGRVSSIESKTGSFATTGSNIFIGNQTITGSVLISGSADYDIDVVGSIRTSGTNPTILVSGSGKSFIGQHEFYIESYGNSPYITTEFGGNLGVYNLSDLTEIGLALDASGFTTNWTNGPVLYVNNTTGNTYDGVFGFQNKTNFTDGRITALKPMMFNSGATITGSVVISGSLDISNANIGSSRYLHTQNNTSTTWSISHNLGYNYPNVTVYDGSNNRIMLPADVISVNANTTEVTFATPEYGFALVSVGGITTATADRFLFTATSATGSWVIDHNMGYKYVNIDVYDNNDEQLIPQKVTAVSVNRTQVDFATPTSGNAIITLGGPRSTSIFNQTGSFYTTQYNIGITGSLVVTGDVDADNFNTTSDKKLKTDLLRIEGALDKIEKLNGYTFNWLEEYNEDRTRQIGLLADEVYEVQPELITKRHVSLGERREEIKLLDYSKVTALLLEGIKELTERVAKLENKRKKK